MENKFCSRIRHVCIRSKRPFQLSSSLRRQVWSAVKRLDTISPKLLIIFDTAHLGLCSSEMFKIATNIFYPAQDRTRYLLASMTMQLPTKLRHLCIREQNILFNKYRHVCIRGFLRYKLLMNLCFLRGRFLLLLVESVF